MLVSEMSLIIVDGHNLLFKSFAVPFSFKSKNGTPLHVVSTYLKYLRTLVQTYKPTDLVVVFDTETVTENRTLSVEYKANRNYDYAEGEDSPFNHLPIIKKVLDFCQIAYIDAINYEADDFIASIVTQANTESYICSTDSDFYQLLNTHCKIIKFLPRMEIEEISEESMSTKFDIKPSEYVFFKSLTGDPADNIKGIPGIGKVRAKSIIQGKMSVDFDKYNDLLELNKKLITLNREIPVEKKVNWSNFLDTNLQLSNREIWEKLKF